MITGYEWSQRLLWAPKVHNISKRIIPKDTQMLPLNFQLHPFQEFSHLAKNLGWIAAIPDYEWQENLLWTYKG
jgi:hypothetical protein